jgi:hypothetical protein
MKLKSNKDHYQGQNEAWKSAIHILKGLLLKCHINFKKYKKKPEIFTTSTYATLASTLKISAQNFDFWPLFRGIKDCWYSILTFWKLSCACELGGLVAWHLVGKRGVKVDPWEWGGLGFNSGWWGLIPWCVDGEAMRWWIEGEGGQ